MANMTQDACTCVLCKCSRNV